MIASVLMLPVAVALCSLESGECRQVGRPTASSSSYHNYTNQLQFV